VQASDTQPTTLAADPRRVYLEKCVEQLSSKSGPVVMPAVRLYSRIIRSLEDVETAAMPEVGHEQLAFVPPTETACSTHACDIPVCLTHVGLLCVCVCVCDVCVVHTDVVAR
jgi:hypothetical protein